MLSPYCANILKLELEKSDYNGMTGDQGWTWLTQPITTNTTIPNSVIPRASIKSWALINSKLGPILAATTASAKTLQLMFSDPDFGTIDTSNLAWQGLMDGLVGDTLLTTNDVMAISSLGNIVKTTISPSRFDSRFSPLVWPHIASDGSIGDDTTNAIDGFPNSIDRADFDIAWIAAGRQ